MKTRKITLTATAYLGEHASPECLTSGITSDALLGLSFFDRCSDMSKYGYARVGMAEIVVDVVDEKAIVESKVESLKAQKEAMLAEAQMKATQFERKIQELLAITYESGAA